MPTNDKAPSPDPSEAPPRDMFTPSQIRMLKVAVIGMGVILLAGFALVIGRIIYLVNRPPVQAASPSATVSAPAPSALMLPEGAIVKHMALSADRLAVHFEGPKGKGIRLLDLAKGTWSPVIPVLGDGENKK